MAGNQKQKQTALVGPMSIERLESSVANALARRRNAIVVHVARQLHARLQDRATISVRPEASVGGWHPIESLSQLRAIVGGRFRNLKEKWGKAGLPIRAHRGDRSERAEVDPEGWTELADWIAKQGFEARLANADEEFLFAVRSIEGQSD